MIFRADVVFSVLGPLFLVLGAVRCARARGMVPQARTWLLMGVIFSAVALWLRLGTIQAA